MISYSKIEKRKIAYKMKLNCGSENLFSDWRELLRLVWGNFSGLICCPTLKMKLGNEF